MTGTLARKPGGIRGRRALRAAIWLGLAVYALYLSAAALAEPPGGKDEAQVPAAMDRFLGLGESDQGKAALFQRPTPGTPSDEIACLALNIYFEARGEPDEGKQAVGHVVMNRVASEHFPGTVCDVVRQGGELRRYRCQFTWWCDGRSDKPRNRRDWEISNEVALSVYWGRSEDPTDGALWYHADYVSPSWRHKFAEGPKIGRHIFYRQPDQEARLASREVSN